MHKWKIILKYDDEVEIKLPEISLSTETWVTVIEQFLMLILIIGRWMLPKGELTRDQLSQLLLVYIGTAADIIEFFDSFKDDKVATHPILVLLTLSICSNNYCCGIDVWGIVLNITLQDAPFLVFRLLLITHFNIISYMNIFFTCKNSLVIVLQLYRLHVVYSENKKNKKKQGDNFKLSNISIISKGDIYRPKHSHKKKESTRPNHHENRSKRRNSVESQSNEDDYYSENETKAKHIRTKTNRKDTGYSTGSSLGSTRKSLHEKSRRIEKGESKCRQSAGDESENQSRRSKRRDKQKLVRSDKHTKGHRKHEEPLSEESASDLTSDAEIQRNLKSSKKKVIKQQSKALSTTDMSSE
ncbi:tmem26 protein [Holotrichia oblita]|uniref:Tmem26 protein n=1 Tax=Holotrichia oblita TaxID=644536 RepID=A0ACB9TEE3_HOLOL|nr:tmem26 protein [Holotrichia oblita]